VWDVVTEQAVLVNVPEAVRRALPADRRGRWTITFTSPTPEGAEYVGRNHPFVAALARYLFEQAFAGTGEAVTARCGAIRTRAVQRVTALLLLRPRFQLLQPGRPPLLAEEVLVTGWELYGARWLSAEEALQLLLAEPAANLPAAEKRELVGAALREAEKFLDSDSHSPQDSLRALLEKRAAELEKSHRRIRHAVGRSVRGLQVQLHWPPDLLGVLVLQPLAGGTR